MEIRRFKKMLGGIFLQVCRYIRCGFLACHGHSAAAVGDNVAGKGQRQIDPCLFMGAGKGDGGRTFQKILRAAAEFQRRLGKGNTQNVLICHHIPHLDERYRRENAEGVSPITDLNWREKKFMSV